MSEVTKYYPTETGDAKRAPKVSNALALVRMRSEILSRVDVIQNIIDVANGKMPDKWSAALAKDLGEDEKPQRLNLSHILDANYSLLRRILPEYKQVEISTAAGGEGTSFEQARALMGGAIKAIVAANGGEILEDGSIKLPEGKVLALPEMPKEEEA